MASEKPAKKLQSVWLVQNYIQTDITVQIHWQLLVFDNAINSELTEIEIGKKHEKKIPALQRSVLCRICIIAINDFTSFGSVNVRTFLANQKYYTQK